jgi:hypothetical protein
VEYTNDYDVPSWQVLQANIPGVNGNVTTTDATVGAVGGAVTERYYRVREQTSNGLSPNVAGFVRFSTCATNAQSWLAGLPIQPYNTAISDVAGWQLGGGFGAPNADMISSWKQNAFYNSILIDLGAYDASDSMYDGLWYNNKTGQLSSDTLSYGEAFWITSRHNTQVMYVEGEVPDAAFAVPVLPNAGSWDMLGYPYPDGQPMNSGGIDSLNYDASGGVNGGNYVQADALYLRACGAGYRIMWLSMTGGWWHEGVGISAETLDSTEGYWINRGTLASGGFTWNVPKPYAYP